MQNEKKLERSKKSYSELRTKSVDALTGDHPNAIWNQLSHVVIDEVWFKAVIRIREQAGHPPLNGHLWSAFITGYGIKQSLAIRRLTDSKDNSASLLAIVNRIRKNAPLLTREVLVGYNGTPMNVEQLFDEMANLGDRVDSSDHALQDQLIIQRWSDADHAHTAFDRLRDATPGSNRSPTDRVSDVVLDRLQEALTSDAIKRVRHRCDKYLAHADLSDLASELAGPTYNDIHDSIKTLVEIKQFLCADFFNHSGSTVVPTYQGNQMLHLSSPLVPELSPEAYGKVFDDVEQEIEEWGNADKFRRFAVHVI